LNDKHVSPGKLAGKYTYIAGDRLQIVRNLLEKYSLAEAGDTLSKHMDTANFAAAPRKRGHETAGFAFGLGCIFTISGWTTTSTAAKEIKQIFMKSQPYADTSI
jgi:hypothetical protein